MSTELDLTTDSASTRALTQVAALTRWVGAGRKLTQTGRLTMADARELVGLLGTGDEIDRAIGDRVFRTRSSEDLRGLATVLAWAKAAGLVRVVHGRLVPVKKNGRLLDRPLELWATMFEAFDKIGEAICPSGWYTSLLGQDFADGVATLLAGIAEGGGAIGVDDANERVWSTLVARYRMDAEQLRHWRKATDRDLRFAVNELIGLGALAEEGPSGGTLRLTALADWCLRRPYGAAAPGDSLAQIKVTLQDTDPPVWRRLLVPASIPLDRLDRVIQAAMVPADPNGRYPTCVAGECACPPEDCGGTPGYQDLIDTLADPDHPDHEDMLRWLGIDKGSDFDPTRFDLADANRRLDAVVRGTFGTARPRREDHWAHGQETRTVRAEVSASGRVPCRA